MNGIKNYWLTRIELKKDIIKAVKQNFVPPIYKQVQKPTKP